MGIAGRLYGYDERDGRGVHLRPLAQHSPRSVAVLAYEQCSSNEQRCARLRAQRIAYRVDIILMLASGSVYASNPIETVVEEVGYKRLVTGNDKSANGDRGNEVPRKR